MSFWDGTRWVADAPAHAASPLRRKRRFYGAAAEAGLITLLIFGLIASSAFAAKGGHGSSTQGAKGHGNTSTFSLVLVDSTDGVAHYGQRITFDVSTTATDKPYVNVRCYQGGAFVYDAWAGFYDSAWFGQSFTLSSSSWQSGAADCEARLVMWAKNGRERTLDAMTFHVEA